MHGSGRLSDLIFQSYTRIFDCPLPEDCAGVAAGEPAAVRPHEFLAPVMMTSLYPLGGAGASAARGRRREKCAKYRAKAPRLIPTTPCVLRGVLSALIPADSLHNGIAADIRLSVQQPGKLLDGVRNMRS